MMNRAQALGLLVSGLLLTAPGCGGSGYGNGTGGESDLPDVEIPTEEEAEAAAADITADNADAAFDDLAREINAELREEG